MSPPLPAAPRPDLWRGILFKVLSTVAFAVLGVCVKRLTSIYPLGELIFFRSAFMLVPVLVLAGFDPLGFKILRTSRLRSHARRAAAGVLGTATTFGTLFLLPLADATALSFSAPLVLVALAGPLMGERIGPVRTGAVVLGFIGVLLIVQPHVAAGDAHPAARWGVLVGICSAIFVALAQMAIRALRAEPAVTTVFYFSLFMSGAALLTMPFGWLWPRSPAELALLVSAGISGGLGQLAATHSYRFADASVLAPYDYLLLIWAVVMGYLVFGEMPLPIVILGAVLVAAAGILIALRERWLMRRGEKIEEHTAPPTA